MNRSTIYEFLRSDDCKLEPRFWKVGKGKYPAFRPPFKWEHCFMLVNGMRLTDFEAVVLFSNELVVRFNTLTNAQINIPYKDIEYIEVREDLDIGYMALHNGNRVKR